MTTFRWRGGQPIVTVEAADGAVTEIVRAGEPGEPEAVDTSALKAVHDDVLAGRGTERPARVMQEAAEGRG